MKRIEIRNVDELQDVLTSKFNDMELDVRFNGARGLLMNTDLYLIDTYNQVNHATITTRQKYLAHVLEALTFYDSENSEYLPFSVNSVSINYKPNTDFKKVDSVDIEISW